MGRCPAGGTFRHVAGRRALFVTPIRPGLVGSGLAHRAAAWQRAIAAVAELHTLVVPVADPGAPAAAAAHTTIVALPSEAGHELGAIRGMALPAVRAAMAAFDDAPALTAAAPPWLGSQAGQHFATAAPFDVVVCFRSYLAPFVAGLRAGSPALAAARMIVDLDDDDAAYHRSRGATRAAEQYERLVTQIAATLDPVLVAAGHHSAPRVGLLPNCVELPTTIADTSPVAGRALLVANLTYAPNIDAVDWYLHEVHPLVAAVQPEAHVRLVGRGGERWADHAGVDVAGLVDDLAPEYAAAQVVIAPVRTGSGTRIKVLEAWAHAKPVVATAAAVDGLVLDVGTHALVADAPPSFADAVLDVLTHPDRAAALAAAGRAHVAHRYGSDVFDRAVAELVTGGSMPGASSGDPAQT